MTKSKTLACSLGTALVLASLGFGAKAHADQPKQCAAAADQAQQLRDEGKYRRAREQMLACARDVCPGPIRRDCTEWLGQLETIASTVVLSARAGSQDVTDVKVSFDDAPLVEKLDGRPITVDAGEHVFRFEYEGETREAKVLIGAGQKLRTIGVTFGEKSPPPGPDGASSPGSSTGVTSPSPANAGTSGGSWAPTIVAATIGVAGLASFAGFGLAGKGEVDDMDATCRPNCDASRVDAARTKLIVADVSLGVGVVALGVATYFFFARPKAQPAKIGAATLDVGFGPTRGGAAAGLSGTF